MKLYKKRKQPAKLIQGNNIRAPTVFMAFTQKSGFQTADRAEVFSHRIQITLRKSNFFSRLRSVFETFTLWKNALTSRESSLCIQAFKFLNSQVRYPCSVLTKKLFKARHEIIKSECLFWQVLSWSVTTIKVGNIICSPPPTGSFGCFYSKRDSC